MDAADALVIKTSLGPVPSANSVLLGYIYVEFDPLSSSRNDNALWWCLHQVPGKFLPRFVRH